MRPIALVLCLIVAITLPACRKGRPAAPPGAEPLRAPVETVRLAPVDARYEAIGTVRSRTTSVLASKLIGEVVAVNAAPGDRVQAGQLLVQINDRDVAAQLIKAKAGHQEAQDALVETESAIRAGQSAKAVAEAAKDLAGKTYARYKELNEKKVISQQEFDEVDAKWKTAAAEAARVEDNLRTLQSRQKQVASRVDQARAEVAVAEAQAAFTRLNAPISGLVTAKTIDVGSQAAPGVPLLTVEDDRNYRLEVIVEEKVAVRLKMGDEAVVTLDALEGLSLRARVGEIVPTADPVSRSSIFKLDLPPAQSVRSGMFGRATFSLGKRDAITVPAAAVSERGQLNSLYVLGADGVAHLRLVKTGRRYGDRVEVLAGLNDGERVVTGRLDALRDGLRVTQE
jgi:multidrug efflux pump subunit AcrA (membrane-fusion protein)